MGRWGHYDNECDPVADEYIGAGNSFFDKNTVSDDEICGYIEKHLRKFCIHVYDVLKKDTKDTIKLCIIPGICLNILLHDDCMLTFMGRIGMQAASIHGDKISIPDKLPKWFPKELADLAVKYVQLEIEDESDDWEDKRKKALEHELMLFQSCSP